MSKRMEGVARTALIRGRAEEIDEFTIADLTAVVVKEGLWGDASRVGREWFRLGMDGAKRYVKQALKGERMNNGACAWVALSSEREALWKPWSH